MASVSLQVSAGYTFPGIARETVDRPLRREAPRPGERVDEVRKGEDTLELSDRARRLYEREAAALGVEDGRDPDASEEAVASRKADGEETSPAPAGDPRLSDEEREQVRELQRVDQEVRAHEQAHMAVGGQYVSGGIQYQYVHGPDGRTYAVGGEVKIDTSKEPTPEQTIQKAMQVRAAALAPANPSPADLQVAANATQMIVNAQQELAQQRRDELTERLDQGGSPVSIGQDNRQSEVNQAYGLTPTAAGVNGQHLNLFL